MSKLTKREEIFIGVIGSLISSAENPDLMMLHIISDAKKYTENIIKELNIKDPDK